MKARRNAWLVLAVILALVLIFLRSVRNANAQEDSSAVPYQGQNTGYYQMFYSPRVRADTFLVDTAKGVVRVLVSDKDGNTAFQKVAVEPAPVASAVSDRYRIYYSPRIRADTFLVDTITGKTWVMAEDKDKRTLFQAVTVE